MISRRFTLLLVLAFASLAFGQSAKKDAFAVPIYQSHRKHELTKQELFSRLPIFGKPANNFMEHHKRFTRFFGTIDLEWDKPRKLGKNNATPPK